MQLYVILYTSCFLKKNYQAGVGEAFQYCPGQYLCTICKLVCIAMNKSQRSVVVVVVVFSVLLLLL